MRCDLAPFGTERRVPGAHRRVRARPRRRRVGARWRLADVGLSRRHPDGCVARPGRARSAGVPAEPRRARRVGQLAAMRRAGIDRNTPDPADGRIERDADGNPTGTLHEGAMSLVNRLLPETSLEHSPRRSCSASSTCTPTGSPPGRTRSSAATAMRAIQVPRTSPPRHPESSPPAWSARSGGIAPPDSSRSTRSSNDVTRYRGGRFAATSVKVMQDGVAENFTASMLEPYCDGHGHPTDNSGISFVPPELLNEAAPRLDALGFQLHFHAIGDRAVRECLDAVQHAIAANGRNDRRHHIAHLQVVHPDDIAALPRARRRGEHAVAVGGARTADGRTDAAVPRLAARRVAVPVRRPAALGRCARGRQRLVGVDSRPARRDPRGGEPHGGARARGGRLRGVPARAGASTSTTSLTAYTAGSAFVNHLDDTGTIAAGKLADLVVLDRDPFAAPPPRSARRGCCRRSSRESGSTPHATRSC